MQPYQEEYVNHMREIAELSTVSTVGFSDFESWFSGRKAAEARIEELRSRNLELLNRHLFPMLDNLYGASAGDIAELEEFSDKLMDWKTNLDCCMYVTIHDALLSIYRVKRDRNAIIRELYKLGMGHYYLNRMTQGIEAPAVTSMHFRNEMFFTEAGSYLRHYDEIDDEQTRGYIVRALANIAICSTNKKRRIATTARTLAIIKDEHYRSLAPGLPWAAFLRNSHQQMSSNRSELSAGSLSKEELALVLDSCYEVFKPEQISDNPSIRWLWPYYEMEYNCGYVDLTTTLDRLERLIRQTSYDSYDVSGLYGNIQLPIYYGRLLKKNPKIIDDPKRVHFLDFAYRKMLKTLLTVPQEHFGDYLHYFLILVFTDYFEIDGLLSYREITARLMQRYSGELYVRSRRAGDMMRCLCEAILEREPNYFSLIPLKSGNDREALLDYAKNCGLYMDFGLVKMNIGRIQQSRNLFEDEYRILQLHTISGFTDLKGRSSTADYADIALGHHRWYNGSDGYPDSYVRTESNFRQMTDVAALVTAMLDRRGADRDSLLRELLEGEGKRFAPGVTACLTDEKLIDRLFSILDSDGEDYYRSVYREINLSLEE